FYMSAVPTLLGQVRNGKLRAVMVTSLKRSAQLPQTPTLAESGYQDFEAVTWFGVLAPAGTPRAVLDALQSAIAQAVRVPEVASQLRGLGAEPVANRPEAFAQQIRADVEKWRGVAKATGVTLE
ncbi:tripartite tricarboxylate transporter substrate-binding protein, partial [Burkholderia sola]|uniref:tripartite tricarboxylate transporter substrate-binding protein n=1 Tax=Burkholderia sola TaxID=2843302 RepID=UPI003390473E